MNKITKSVMIIATGLLLIIGGALLRLNAPDFAMRTTRSPYTAISPDGKRTSHGFENIVQEDPQRTAAVKDIGVARLYTGGAVLAVGCAGWLFGSRSALTSSA